MNHLLRSLAPLTPEAWKQVDDEAKERLSVALGARRLVDFAGPLGWEHSATNTGRVGPAVDTSVDGVTSRARVVIPLAEVRADFALARSEVDAASRGAVDVDFDALDKAAMMIARLENATVFDGWDEMGMVGIAQATTNDPVALGDEDDLPATVAQAVAVLKKSDVGGPYALAVDPEVWVAVTGGSDDGYPAQKHIERVLGGPVQWVPGIKSPVVLSMRGGDFVLESGQDLAVGYSHHDGDNVHLYLQETFSFRVATPEAAVVLR